MLCWAMTSRPIVGSSRNSTSGECSRAAMSSIFMRSPSESSRTGWLSKRRTSSRSTSSSCVWANCGGIDAVDLLMQAERFGGRKVPPQADFSDPSRERSAGDRHSRVPRAQSPSTWAVPPVGLITPERSLSVVVLPAPLGPRNATNSPSSTLRSMPRTAFTSLYSRWKSPWRAARRPSFFW